MDLKEDIQLKNKFLDKFVKNVYDIDMFISTNPYPHPKIIVYPYKFLKNSPDFNPNYLDLMYEFKAQEVFKTAMQHLGGSNASVGDLKYVLSSNDLGTYLNDYIKNVEYLVPMFFSTDYLPEEMRDVVKDTDVKFSKARFNGGFTLQGRKIEPKISLAFKVSKEANNVINNYNTEFMDYLSNNMNIDDQINIWFYN